MKSCLYDTDYYQWSLDQADYLKNRRFDMIDYDCLIEEIESLGRSQKDRLVSFLTIALLHLLKIKYQPNLHTRSWDISIQCSINDAQDVLEENPSLKHKLEEIFFHSYRKCRRKAAVETGLEIQTFPEECPWSMQEIITRK